MSEEYARDPGKDAPQKGALTNRTSDVDQALGRLKRVEEMFGEALTALEAEGIDGVEVSVKRVLRRKEDGKMPGDGGRNYQPGSAGAEMKRMDAVDKEVKKEMVPLAADIFDTAGRLEEMIRRLRGDTERLTDIGRRVEL